MALCLRPFCWRLSAFVDEGGGEGSWTPRRIGNAIRSPVSVGGGSRAPPKKTRRAGPGSTIPSPPDVVVPPFEPFCLYRMDDWRSDFSFCCPALISLRPLLLFNPLLLAGTASWESCLRAGGSAGFCFGSAALRVCGPPKKQSDKAKFLGSPAKSGPWPGEQAPLAFGCPARKRAQKRRKKT